MLNIVSYWKTQTRTKSEWRRQRVMIENAGEDEPAYEGEPAYEDEPCI